MDNLRETLDSLRVDGVLDLLMDDTQGISGAYPTGFPSLDRRWPLGGLRPGLNILGGMTATGKTSFALQIADHVASTGNDVLFVSLEMSVNELLAKSLSRLTSEITAGRAGCSAWLAREILERKSEVLGDYKEPGEEQEALLKDAYERYKEKIAPQMYIHEARGPLSTGDVARLVEAITESRGTFPLVVVDYIQMLTGENYSDKQNMDDIVLGLKHISVEHDVPVLAISSLSRYGYLKAGEVKTPAKWVSISAFKESGSIEYSADLLMAFKKIEDTNEKVELQILKNRRGPAPRAIKLGFDGSCGRFSDLEEEERLKKEKENAEAVARMRKWGTDYEERRKKRSEAAKAAAAKRKAKAQATGTAGTTPRQKETWEEFNTRYMKIQQEREEAAKARIAATLAGEAEKEA